MQHKWAAFSPATPQSTPIVRWKRLKFPPIFLHVKVSPSELVQSAGFSRRPHGAALAVMQALLAAAQGGGADLTTQLLSCGFIDTLMSALSAVEQVGADHVNGCAVVLGALWLLWQMDGRAMPQIEDKLRAIPSALRYVKDSNISHMLAIGATASTIASIVAANLFGKDEENPFGFAREYSCSSHITRSLLSLDHLAVAAARGRHRWIHDIGHRVHALRKLWPFYSDG